MDAQSEFDLLGLFQGVGLPFRSESAPMHMPNMIWLYRRPILDYRAEHDDSLGEIVTHVLVHEIGHHFGMSDEDMEDRTGGRLSGPDGAGCGGRRMKIDGACSCGAIKIEGEADPDKPISAIAPIARPRAARHFASRCR